MKRPVGRPPRDPNINTKGEVNETRTLIALEIRREQPDLPPDIVARYAAIRMQLGGAV